MFFDCYSNVSISRQGPAHGEAVPYTDISFTFVSQFVHSCQCQKAHSNHPRKFSEPVQQCGSEASAKNRPALLQVHANIYIVHRQVRQNPISCIGSDSTFGASNIQNNLRSLPLVSTIFGHAQIFDEPNARICAILTFMFHLLHVFPLRPELSNSYIRFQ